MAQTIDISTLPSGVSIIEIDGAVEQTNLIAIQVTTNAIDSQIELSLVQSNEDIENYFNELPERPIKADAGSFSNLLQTKSFYSNVLALKLDKLSATSGTITILNPYNV